MINRKVAKEAGEIDDIDINFGHCSTIEKSIIQYLNEEYEE